MSNILDIQGWSVSVEVDAETILTIGHNSLSGIDDFTEAQAQVIRNCAEHLLAFIGTPSAATPSEPAVDAGARDESAGLTIAELAAWHRDQQTHYSAFGDLQSKAPGRPVFDAQCFRTGAAFHAAARLLLEDAALSASTEAAGEPVAWPHEITRGHIECLINDHQRDGQKQLKHGLNGSGSYLIRVAESFRWCLEQMDTAPPAASGQRPTDDALWDQTLDERDSYHLWADKLAEAIALHLGIDIGEHSSANLPWHNALDAIMGAPSVAELTAASGQKLTDEHIRKIFLDNRNSGGTDITGFARAILRASSATASDKEGA